VGKTRLAIELARRLEPSDGHPDGCWLVDLGKLREPDLVPAMAAAAIGLRSPGHRPDIASMVDLLRGHRALLVLDNCEHLAKSAAALATGVLAGCPGVTVLITSREPLRVPGEIIWRVPPLQLPDPAPPADPAQLGQLAAVQLFIERARTAVPGFVLDATTIRPVTLICRRLDGIPLAIELAAGRLAHLSAAELAALLDNALDLLSYDLAERSDRRTTLAGTIGWSYDLLTDAERALLRRLSIFAEDFALDAVEALATGAITDPIGTLSRLIDKSLVLADTAGSAGKYHLLQIVRQYAAALLKPAERLECQSRHRQYRAERAAQLDPVAHTAA
jgi:predicted ATPase